MLTLTIHVDAMTSQGEAFAAVADLMQRGHYFPDGVTLLRESAPRPFSPTEAFLPGQRAAFHADGQLQEHVIEEVKEWDEGEAWIVERPLNGAKDERLDWRLAELTPGTIRIEVTYTADVGVFEKVKRANQFKRFWGEALRRLKVYLEDKRSFAGARTFAPKPPGSP